MRCNIKVYPLPSLQSTPSEITGVFFPYLHSRLFSRIYTHGSLSFLLQNTEYTPAHFNEFFKSMLNKASTFDEICSVFNCMWKAFMEAYTLYLYNLYLISLMNFIIFNTQVVAMDCTRINSLRFFAEFLCGLELPLLAYRKSRGGFFSVAPEYLHVDPEADVVEEMVRKWLCYLCVWFRE